MKRDFFNTYLPSYETISAGENNNTGTKSRLTTAYSQNEVNGYLAAAVIATIATVGTHQHSVIPQDSNFE